MLLMTYNIGAVFSLVLESVNLKKKIKITEPMFIKMEGEKCRGDFFSSIQYHLTLVKLIHSINKLKGNLAVRWLPIQRFLRT